MTSRTGSMSLEELEATISGDRPDGKEPERFEKFLNEPEKPKLTEFLGETEKDRNVKDESIKRIESNSTSKCEHGVENCPLNHSEVSEPGYLWHAAIIVGIVIYLFVKMNS